MTSFHLLSSFSSIIFHFESSIFKNGVISFLTHIFANTEYAEANSKGVISQVHRASGAQYIHLLFSEFTHNFFINDTIFFSHPAIKNILIAGIFLELFNAVEIFIFHMNFQSKFDGVYQFGNFVCTS